MSTEATDAAGAGAGATRRCWRCLKQFPTDPTLPTGHPAEWWVCDACDAALFPGRHGNTP